MPLTDLEIPRTDGPLPPEVRRFIRDADRRIADFQIWARGPAFVPSNFEPAYRVLRAVTENPVARGTRFCEWGSGFGAVTCLAAMLEFEAVGRGRVSRPIEVQELEHAGREGCALVGGVS